MVQLERVRRARCARTGSSAACTGCTPSRRAGATPLGARARRPGRWSGGGARTGGAAGSTGSSPRASGCPQQGEERVARDHHQLGVDSAARRSRSGPGSSSIAISPKLLPGRACDGLPVLHHVDPPEITMYSSVPGWPSSKMTVPPGSGAGGSPGRPSGAPVSSSGRTAAWGQDREAGLRGVRGERLARPSWAQAASDRGPHRVGRSAPRRAGRGARR